METNKREEAPRKTTILPKRGERGSGTSITLDFSEHADILQRIREAAKADDREPSKYLRRRILQLDQKGELIPKKAE